MENTVFSKKFVREIVKACGEDIDGFCLSKKAVAERIRESGTMKVGRKNPSVSVLAFMVGEAVRRGEVDGVAMRRGRDGGLFRA